MELFKLIGTIVIENDAAIGAIGDTTEKVEQSESKMLKAFKKIGGAVVGAFAVDKIKDFGKSCIESASDMNAVSSQFSQVFGNLEADAANSLSSIADQTGVVENRMKESYTKIAAFAKTTGMDTAEAMDLADRSMIAIADSAAFYDRTLEETTETLQSFLKGNYENDAALGLSCTETTRNAAANELYGKSFKELSEQQKQLTLLKMVEDANKLSGAMGQASRESDTWSNQTGNLKQAWKDFEAIIGATFLPTMISLVSGLSDGIQWASDKLMKFQQWCAENETIITILAIAVGTITTAIIAYNIAMNATTIATTIATTATKAFGAVMAFVQSPITLVIVAIGALIAIGVALYKNWDVIKEKCAELWSNLKKKFASIKEFITSAISTAKEKVVGTFQNMKDSVLGIFDKIKSGITDKITKAKNTIEGIVNKIKGIFNFTFKLPKIKMPHFSIKPSGWKIGDLMKGSIPKLGIEWYAKGGVMTEPTVFGMNGNNAMVGGEAGAEAIAPIDVLQKYVAEAVASQNAVMAERFDKLTEFLMSIMPQMLANMGCDIVLDSGALVGTLAPSMDAELGRLAVRNGRAV